MVNENLLGYESIEEAIDDTEYTSQVEALARMMCGESVFLSGVAGAGKSFVINRFVSVMQEFFLHIGHEPEKLADVVVVSGATGLAAANLGGRTIHSVSGLGICDVPIESNKMFDRDYQDSIGLSRAFFVNFKKLKELEILVIDEVSMLSALFLDNLNKVLQKAKRSNKPFGGVVMVFVGDFMQLPPVAKSGAHDEAKKLAFESQAWKELDPKLLFMKKSRRSQDDRLNVILDDMREGKLSEETRDFVKMCKEHEEKSSYVRLFTKNRNVDSYNIERLQELSDPSVFYDSYELVVFDGESFSPNVKTYKKNKKKIIDAARKQLNISEDGKLELRKGAVVTITNNIRDTDGSLVIANGDTGEVVKTGKGFVNVRLNRTGKVETVKHSTVRVPLGVPYTSKVKTDPKVYRDFIDVSYIPIKLSFATTVHKSQGQTLHGVVVDLTSCFTPGLGYVAMSRVASLDNLVISKIGKSAFSTDKRCAKMSKEVEEQAKINRNDFKENKDSYGSIINMPNLLTMFWKPL